MEAAVARRLERVFWSWQARTWDELLTPPAAAARVEATVQRLRAHLAVGVVVDAACGTGLHARALTLSNYEVIAIDFAAGMVERASRHAPTLRADLAGPWPLRDSAVDAVVSVFTLQFFTPSAFLARVAAVLRPGGVALLEWPRGGTPNLSLPANASFRLRVAQSLKRTSVILGGRLGVARVHAPDQVRSDDFEIVEATTLERSHVVVLRRK